MSNWLLILFPTYAYPVKYQKLAVNANPACIIHNKSHFYLWLHLMTQIWLWSDLCSWPGVKCQGLVLMDGQENPGGEIQRSDLWSGTLFLSLSGILFHSSFKSKMKTHLFSFAYWFVVFFLLILPTHHQPSACICSLCVCVCVCVRVCVCVCVW